MLARTLSPSVATGGQPSLPDDPCSILHVRSDLSVSSLVNDPLLRLTLPEAGRLNRISPSLGVYTFLHRGSLPPSSQHLGAAVAASQPSQTQAPTGTLEATGSCPDNAPNIYIDFCQEVSGSFCVVSD